MKLVGNAQFAGTEGNANKSLYFFVPVTFNSLQEHSTAAAWDMIVWLQM
jgi:hypothetical protein